MENAYKVSERKGRNKMKKLCDQRGLQYFDNPVISAPYDGNIVYGDQTYLVEVKDRDPQYERYDTILLEKSKYDNITWCVNATGSTSAYYACFYGNHAYVIDLFRHPIGSIQPATVECNKMTVEDRGRTDKLVYFIPKNWFEFCVIQ